MFKPLTKEKHYPSPIVIVKPALPPGMYREASASSQFAHVHARDDVKCELKH